MLILYYATFWTHVVVLGVDSLKFNSKCKYGQFCLFFLIYMLFISFSCLISLARTSNLEQTSIIGPDLRGKAFRLSPLTVMLPVGFFVDAFSKLTMFAYISSFLKVFKKWVGIEFCHCFLFIEWYGWAIFLL